MNEVTLEKIDIIKERSDASYSEAKEALECCSGNVVDALIYLENKKHSKKDELYTTTEGLFTWLKELIKKGNVTRIRIKKDEKVIADVPVNAGVATGALALIYPPLIGILGIGALAAVFTKITIEITKTDGSVEIINKVVKHTTDNVKDKVSNFAEDIKTKYTHKNDKHEKKEDNVYQYTVKFEEIDDEKDEEIDDQKDDEKDDKKDDEKDDKKDDENK